MGEAAAWERLRQLFHRALELPPAARAAFVAEQAAGEPGLAADLAALLAAYDEAGDFLETGIEGSSPELAALCQSAVAGAPIGSYRVIRELGRGGMGAVYLASRDDASYEQRVAIKLIKRGMDSAEILGRFLAERQILATLVHPHIARLLDGGSTSDGRPFLVMEYIEGETIDAYCRRQGLGLAAKLALFGKVARAVAFAHQYLVVHRDLKPANILVGLDGEPKLLDFGIAKLLGPHGEGQGATEAGGRPRTPDYASPEQIAGGPITTATDVYGLGLLLCELLTGALPRRGPGAPGRASALARERGEAGLERALRGDLDAILATALAAEPDRRYGSVRELAEDLERFLARHPVRARPPTVAYRFRSFVRRHRLATAAATLLALLGLTAAGLALALGRERVRVARQGRQSAALAAFLTDLFRVADPGANRGATVTARELLAAGTRQLEAEAPAAPSWLEISDGRARLEPATRALLLERVGEVYGNLGLLPEAERALNRSLALRRAEPGAEAELAAAGTLLLLAGAKREQGELGEAKRLLAAALDSREKLGASPLEMAQVLSALGAVEALQEDFAAGRAHLAEAIVHQRRASAPAELDLAASLASLATLEINAGFPELAGEKMAEALRIDRRRLGEDHPRTLADLTNLAGILYRGGNFAAAERLTREVLERRRRVLGEDHPEVAETWISLSTLAWARADLPAAEQAAQEAVSIYRRLGLASHPNLAQALANLGSVRMAAHRLAAAESALGEALATFRSGGGAPAAGEATVLNSLAQVARERGQLRAAEGLLRQAIELWAEILGPESRDGAASLNSLAGVLADAGRRREAEELYRQSLAIRRKLLPADHPDLAHSLLGLGRLLLRRGLPAEAEPLLAEAVALRRRSFAAGSPAMAQAEELLATCRQALAASQASPGRARGRTTGRQ